jgi:hypothetical protein
MTAQRVLPPRPRAFKTNQRQNQCIREAISNIMYRIYIYYRNMTFKYIAMPVVTREIHPLMKSVG